MQTIRQILEEKGTDVVCVAPDSLVQEMLEVWAEHDIGAVAVVGQAGLEGIASERDYARKIALLGRTSKLTQVRDIMGPVHRIGINALIQDAMAHMTEARTRHLVVQDGGKMVGLVSIGDLVKALMDDQRFEIEQMSRYVQHEAPLW